MRFRSHPRTGADLPAAPTSYGLGEHTGAVLLLVLTSGFVGGMVGIERTVLPLIAEAKFGIASKASAIAFIATFGATKAAVNFFAGRLSERWGRRPVLLLGWLVGLPVPLLLMHAPTWSWILAANVLLGVNQALTWSMTVVMKVDLTSPRAHGLVIGWNEAVGYGGMAGAAALTGYIASAYGLWPEPFYVGLGLAGGGLAISWFTRETRPRPAEGPSSRIADGAVPDSLLHVAYLSTFGHPTLSAASLAGLVTNLKDGTLWGLLSILLSVQGVPIGRVGVVAALYPAVWAVSQLVFGPLSDRVGRKPLIVAGLLLQALGVGGFAVGGSYVGHLAAATLTGIGTGMVYPTLQVLVSDVAGPVWRASALGVYRFWRDLGYALGALGAGAIADAAGLRTAIGTVAVLVAGAAIVVRLRA